MQYKTFTHIPLFEGFCKKNSIDNKDIVANIGGIDLMLNVASTDESKSKGFIGLEEPTDDIGMLFVYENEDILSFWMKGVSFPLDILFFNSNLELVDAFTMEPHTKNNNPIIYNCNVTSQYAVELKGGWLNRNITEPSDIKLKF